MNDDADCPRGERPASATRRAPQLTLMWAVALLHRAGFESVRVFPYMSASGLFWRFQVCALESVDIAPEDAADVHAQFDGDEQVYYSSAGCVQFDDWDEDLFRRLDAGEVAAEHLAHVILQTLPSAQRRPGADPRYVQWYLDLVEAAETLDDVPIAFYDTSDWDHRREWRFLQDGLAVPAPPPVPEGLLGRG